MQFDILRDAARPLTIGPIVCPKTSATKYQPTEGATFQNSENLQYTATET